MNDIIITKQQIKNAEEMLRKCYYIAVQTDEDMGNKDGENFLSDNPDYLYYKACIDMLNRLGLDVQRTNRRGKIVHLIY